MELANRSHNFILGLEAGMIFSKMDRKEPFIGQAVHNENLETIKSMIQHFGYRVTIVQHDATWSLIDTIDHPGKPQQARGC